jgi:MFS family permease
LNNLLPERRAGVTTVASIEVPATSAGLRRLSRLAAWTNMVVAALVMLATFPSRTQGLGWITEPLLEEFSLGRLQYSELNFWATLGTALFCVPCGWCVDRLGTRLCLLVGVPALSAATLWMSTIYPAEDPVELATAHTQLFLALMLCRMLGQGFLALVSTALVGKSFPRKVGVAMGVYSVLIGLGFSGATKLVGVTLTEARGDWRDVWFWIALSILAVLLPLGLFLVREPPPPASPGAAMPGEQASERPGDVSFLHALGMPVFWMCLLATFLVGVVNSGLALFYQSVLGDLGYSRKEFFDILAFGLMLGAGFKLAGGWLAAQWSIGRLQAMVLVTMAGCLAWLPYLHGLAQLYAYAVFMSFAMSIYVVLYFAVWSHAFGRKELGQIQGAAHVVSVLASAVGPQILALSREYTGSYARSFISLAVAVGVLGVAFFFIRIPCADEPADQGGT